LPRSASVRYRNRMRNDEGERIVEPNAYGQSEMMTVQGRRGYFDWDAPYEKSPFVGGGKSPMYKFVVPHEDGSADTYYLRLEKDKQGGRWEDAWHAETEYAEMAADPRKILQMWGVGPVAREVSIAIDEGISFEEAKKRLKEKELDTWRQISED